MPDISEPVVALLGLPNLAVPGEAALSGSTLLAGDSLSILKTTVALSSSSSLGVDVLRIAEAISMESSQSTLTADVITVAIGQSDLASGTVVFANGGIVYGGESAIDAASDLAADATYVVIASNAALSGGGSLSDLEAEPIYRLKLPTVEYAITKNILLSRYPIHVGQTLLITGTTGTIVEVPVDSDLQAADFAFRGGRIYQLSQIQYDAVVAAGYGDLVEVA